MVSGLVSSLHRAEGSSYMHVEGSHSESEFQYVFRVEEASVERFSV